jgi:NitT/TauT family transport system substrate-binding protein
MQRRTLLKSSALFALGSTIPLALSACNSQPSSQTATNASTKPLLVGISGWPGWGAHYIAVAKNFYKEAGLNIEVKTFSSFTELDTAFLAGQVDMAYIGGADLMVLNQKTPIFRGVMVSDYSYGADGVIARGDIKTIADLKGKKVAIEDTPYNAIFIDRALKSAGLTIKDINVLAMATDAAATAMITGQVDGAVLYQPFLDKAVTEGKCNILTTTRGTNISPNILATTTKVLGDRKAEITAYIKAYGKAMDLYRGSLTETSPIVAKEVGIKPEEVVQQLKGIRNFTLKENLEVSFSPTDDLSIYKSLDMMNDILVTRGMLSQKVVDIKGLFDESALRSALG